MTNLNMATIAFFLTIAALFVTDITSAMDSPMSEFGYRDLVKAGIVPQDKIDRKYSKTATRGGSPTISKTTSVILIAQAKLRGKQYPSVPYIIADVEPNIPGCGNYDWLFLPKCAGAVPKNNVRPKKAISQALPRAIVHVYVLPSGWKNLKLSMDSHGQCRGSRIANMRSASRLEKLCHRAQFHKRSCCRCGRRKYGMFGPRKWKCSWLECDSSHLVIRRLQHVSYTDGSGKTDTIPQVLSSNGQKYAGFSRCDKTSFLFRK